MRLHVPRSAVRWAITVAVAAAVVALAVASGFDIAASAQYVREADWRWLAAAAFAFMVMRVLRAWRWGLVFPLLGLAPPRMGVTTRLILVSDFANILAPHGVITAGKGVLASRVLGLGLSPVAATLAIELLISAAVSVLIGLAFVPYLLTPDRGVAAVLPLATPLLALALAGPLIRGSILSARSVIEWLPSTWTRRFRSALGSPGTKPTVGALRRVLLASFAIDATRCVVFAMVAIAIGGFPMCPSSQQPRSPRQRSCSRSASEAQECAKARW